MAKNNGIIWIILAVVVVLGALYYFKPFGTEVFSVSPTDKVNVVFSKTAATVNEQITATYTPTTGANSFWAINVPIPSGWTATAPGIVGGSCTVDTSYVRCYSASQTEGQVAPNIPITWKAPASATITTFTGDYTIGQYSGTLSNVQVSVTTCSPTAELCDNKDNDCDSTIDEGLSQSCYTGASGTSGVGLCKAGTQACSAGVWATCSGQVIPVTEVCGDALDNDCDASTDENRNSQADTGSTCDGKVSWSEFITYAQGWLAGTNSWNNFVAAAQAWVVQSQL